MNRSALGVGITYAPGIEPLLVEGERLFTVVEIEPQMYWYQTSREEERYRVDPAAMARFQALPQTKIIHGVGFPVGGARRPDPRHLPPFLRMIEALNAVWASEHLSFNQAGGPQGDFYTGFLLPPRQTEEGVATAAERIREVAGQLPVPFSIETGVNYLRPRKDELTDGAFVGAVAEEADCGILLDLHNLWANERNGRQSVEAFLAEIPLDRVWEVHLAGGFEYRGYWLDAHSGEVPSELMALAGRILPMLPNLKALIFEILAPYIPRVGLDRLKHQAERLHILWENRAPASGAGHSVSPPPPRIRTIPNAPNPIEWEDLLGAIVIGRKSDHPLDHVLAEDPGVAVLSALAKEARAGMLVDALTLTCRLLLLHQGADLFRELLGDFWRRTPPELFASAEAEAFSTYLDIQSLNLPHLSEVLAFERAVLLALIDGKRSRVRFSCEPIPLLKALARAAPPDAAISKDCEIDVTAERVALLLAEIDPP